MAILTRNDGTQFIIQAYRETLDTSKRSVMMNELRALTEQHGQYLYFKRKDKAHVEVSFSKEPGYLLSECIWHYFGKPRNLIYCEALPDTKAEVLIVIVRNNEIYLDAKVRANTLRTELLPLMMEKAKYKVVTSGIVPLSDTMAASCFVFPGELVDTFERLPEPLFPSIPPVKSVQMLPLVSAIKTQKLWNYRPFAISMVVGLIVLAGFGWFMYNIDHLSVAPVRRPVVAKRADIYGPYEKAMQQASPRLQMAEMAETIDYLYLMPGWEAKDIQLNHQRYAISVSSDGGDLQVLGTWAAQHYFQYQITQQGPELTTHSQLPKRRPPSKIYPVQQVVSVMVDEYDQLLHTQAVTVGATRMHGVVKETSLVLNLNGISPSLLDLIGQELTGMPATLNSADIHLNSGLIEGTIHLSVWGT